MESHAAQFLEKATCAQLKDKLGQLGKDTTGNKAALKMRLEETIITLTTQQLQQYFPQNVHFVAETENNSGQDNESEDDQLDSELENLRIKLKKKQEIMELKRKLMELNNEMEETVNTRTSFNFRDIEESLTTFNGENGYTIQKWVQHLEESAETLGWDSKMCFVYARRLLTGTAKLFLRASTFKSWQELKAALLKEFNKTVSTAEIHSELRNRRKKPDETFQQYLFTMQEIASSAYLDEADIVHYIINGINDSTVNKTILYGADTLDDLKSALRKYEKIVKENKSSYHIKQKPQQHQGKNKSAGLRCYNCNNFGHVSHRCPQPKRDKGLCFKCERPGHKAVDCKEKVIMSITHPENQRHRQLQEEEEDRFVGGNNDFEFVLNYTFGGDNPQMKFSCDLYTLIDSGSPISFVQQQYLPAYLMSPVEEAKYKFYGINDSFLNIIGITNVEVCFNNSIIDLKLFIVKDHTMKYPLILGRDFINKSDLELRKKKLDNKNKVDNGNCEINEGLNKSKPKSCIDVAGMLTNFNEEENFINEILNINIYDANTEINFKINENLPFNTRTRVINILKLACLPKNNTNPKVDLEMEIKLTNDKPFYCTPRRLPFTHKVELQKILDDLLYRGIIRESDSPYTSPIVLVSKKNKELRLCVDYRELNRVTVRDNFPLPLIEDHLDRLKNKKYFSVLDLKNGFHHVRVAENSIKYTSFITPIGQYEYLRMPFGLKNAPAIFEKYMKKIFKSLIASGKILTYIDDVLIATDTVDEHIDILKEVIDIANENCLQLRFDKCSFLQNEITYLGYKVNVNGIQPNEENLKAIKDFPTPSCTKGVQSFLGLCSYFRKFIKDFATLAKPLYDLIKKDKEFKFGEEQLNAFQILKDKLLQSPVLAIYSPHSETELHCDASTLGFGAILMQKQTDGKFHPVSYFSKRVSEVESKYHSFELETLAMIYALRRFHIYLTGLKFKIITDCQSLAQTLKKGSINPRISRWALELQSYDFVVEHRNGNRMLHADALSRSINILNVRDDSFEYVLATSQRQDPLIVSIASDLEKQESSLYEMVDGLIYRKVNGDIRFYVPKDMENRVIQTHHDAMCHVGINKCYEHLKKVYWFPDMKSKIRRYIKSCLKCIYFSPISGKVEGELHSIPKGILPFDTLHIDHYGPINSHTKKRHIFIVIDGFTKFVKLFPVNSTSSKDAIKCLEGYFEYYSRPNRIISDRGTCFTSQEFSDFMTENSIIHIKIATLSPQSNGQVERVNRTLTQMLAKECEVDSTGNWYKHLVKVEYAMNNTVNRSTGFTPSMLLFGVNQKGHLFDKMAEYIQKQLESTPGYNRVDLIEKRRRADEKIRRSQDQNKIYYDKRHKKPYKYKKGEYVMLKNNVSMSGVNKKLFAKYRGPYEIEEILDNDRYIVKDLDGMQITRIPYRGVCSPANMKPFLLSIDANVDT